MSADDPARFDAQEDDGPGVGVEAATATLKRGKMSESPNTVHGRLLEAIHLSGYTFERACSELEHLLEEDRWQQVGDGFSNIGAFLATVDLSDFRIDAPHRKRLAKKLADLEASQRATAKALGVDESTVRQDLGKRSAVNPAPAITDTAESLGLDDADAGNPAPAPNDGREAARQIREKQEAEVRREEKRTEKVRQLEDVSAQDARKAKGIYDVIVIDPPWPMEKIERDVRPNQVAFDYPTMTADELADPEHPKWHESAPPKIAADDCHLFCWTTQKHLPTAIRLATEWGFRYCVTMVWHKPGGYQPVGLPQYNCEFVVYARRGSPIFLDTKAFDCCFTGQRREHSRKPDEFYETVRRVTGGVRIDLFSRGSRNGFEAWGNETEKFAEVG